MKRGRRLLLVGSAVFVGMTMASVGGQQAQPPAGGAFTAAQAQAGQAAYAQQCAGCHSADFRGSGDAPALAGPDFIAKWGPRAVNELFTYLVQTMPPTNPGSLGEAGTLEVTAYSAPDQRGTRRPAAVDGHGFDADERAARTAAAPAPRADGGRARRDAAGAWRRHRRRPGSRWGISESRRDRSRRGEELRPRHFRDAQNPPPGDWLIFRGNYHGHSYSPLIKSRRPT